DKLVALLLRAGKREPTPLGRCISLCSLAIYIYKELEAKTFNEDVKGALYVLLNALRQCSSVTAPASGRSPLNRTSEFRVKKVAQIACDMLYLVSDHALTLTTLAPSMAGKIIEEISATLANLVADIENGIVDEEKRLLISLELCLAEWCMKLPAGFLLQSWPEDGSNSLLDTVLQAYGDIVVLKATKSPSTSTSMPPTVPLDGFENDTCREDNNPGSNSSTLTPSHTKLNASISRKNRGNHKTEDNLTSVKMGAQFVMDHLLNQLGHYPLGSDPARHTSMVSEGDDLASLDHSNSAFNLHNVQIFVLNGTKLLSFVELPTLLGPGGGVPFGLLTDKSEVRIIVRDLNGKHCWDSAILYNDTSMCDNSEETPDSLLLSVPGKREDTFLMSSSMINERFLVAPHNTVRHRPSGELPSWVNTEQDMDNLHDVLSYVKYTSSEVTGDTDLTSPRPPPSCITTEMEEEAITFSLSERTHENDFIEKFRSDVTMVSHPHEEPEIVENHMPFHMCRMFMSQLGLLNVESRPHIQLLKKNDQLIRELRNLDNQKCRETHKIAVIYVAQGQEDKVSILSNGAGSSEFEDFVARLGWETRHLGNDEVHIVWSEHTRDYRRGIIPTEFCDVLIIIYPLPNGLFRIQVSKKQDIPFIGPLFNESIVDKSCLPGLVRATALNASRAKRSLLPLYQTFFEERNYALQSLVEQFALPSSFEEFSYQVITPSVQGHFQPVSSRMSTRKKELIQIVEKVKALKESPLKVTVVLQMKAIRRDYKQLLKQKKREAEIWDIKQLSESFKMNDTKVFWRKIQDPEKRKSTQQKCPEPETWPPYCEIGNDTAPLGVLNSIPTEGTCSPLQEHDYSLLEETKEEEIKNILKNQKGGTAPGLAGIPIIVYKKFALSFVPIMVLIFNAILSTCKLPEAWKTSVILPLSKREMRRNTPTIDPYP
ncbi:hypothetical protein QYM36_014625, partial [Artemia franciscana]